MKVARRRFFGLVAVPALAKGAPAIAAPVVEMVEADIAPVVAPASKTIWYEGYDVTVDTTLTVSDWAAFYIRPKMIALANQIDDEVRDILIFGEKRR